MDSGSKVFLKIMGSFFGVVANWSQTQPITLWYKMVKNRPRKGFFLLVNSKLLKKVSADIHQNVSPNYVSFPRQIDQIAGNSDLLRILFCKCLVEFHYLRP